MRKFAAVLFIGLVALSAPARAQPAFAGKTVTVVVGYGGYDRIARLVAKYLPRYLPGNPGGAVRNLPGDNSIVAANYVYNVADPDGLTIGLFDRNLILGQLINIAGVRYDMRKFVQLGSMASETSVLVVRTGLPLKTFDELRQSARPVILGATGPGSNTYDFPLLLKAFLNIPIRIVSGYPSSADIMQAVVRGDVDGRAGSYSSVKSFIDRGVVRALVRSRGPDAEIARLPVDEDLAPTAQAKQVMALRSIPEVVGRPFVAPPGTPPAIANLLQQAIAKVASDRAFLTEAGQAHFLINFIPGDRVGRIDREVLGAPPGVVKIFSQFFKFAE
jgi:tripartite-type tricarboxylate transporter receptor subunit TctC